MTTPSPETLERGVRVLNRYGIHARPAALLVKAAAGFPDTEIFIRKGDFAVNAKSIMGLLTLEGHHGLDLVLSASGPRAAEALDALETLFRNKFHEE
jgi:phosphotransferase system HPr (HPr) family protein